MSEVVEQAMQRVLDRAKRCPPANEPPPVGLARFTLKGRSAAMREKMLHDVHVLGRVALLGQYTVFYAAPGTGKTLITLWMLRQSIDAGVIDGSQVFYVNCDDTYKGIVAKTEFAESVGFHQLADGLQGFKASELLAELTRMAGAGQARGVVVILDTLKKFVTLMDKSKQTAANKVLRGFVQAGGTVIALAHVNKHRGDDGALVYQGTTDQVDDADCAYIMDVVERYDAKAVTYHNIKARGDVVATCGLEYVNRQGMSWRQKLDTIQPMDEAQIAAAKREDAVAARLEKNADLIEAIGRLLANGPMLKTELEKAARDETGDSKKRIKEVLKAHTGTRWHDGHRWSVTVGERNANEYEKLQPPPQWIQN